jgi:hypothetical protein
VCSHSSHAPKITHAAAPVHARANLRETAAFREGLHRFAGDTDALQTFRSPRVRRFESSSSGFRTTDNLLRSLSHAFTCFSNCLISRRAARVMERSLRRNARCSAIASAERFPCLQFARRHFSRPSGVRGSVLAPPCSRQRVYRPLVLLHIAGARHGLPDLVLAPQRGLEEGSPLQDRPFPLYRCSETGAMLCIGSAVKLANIAMRTRNQYRCH